MFCIDYWKLGFVAVIHAYSSIIMEEGVDVLGDAGVLLTMETHHGYCHIYVDKRDKDKMHIHLIMIYTCTYKFHCF